MVYNCCIVAGCEHESSPIQEYTENDHETLMISKAGLFVDS